MARSQPLSSALVSVIVAMVCSGVLATTGQTAAQESAVLARIDEAGTRSIVVTESQGGPGFDPSTLERITALSNVEWVFGLGSTVDVRNTALAGAGDPVPARVVFGSLPPELEVTRGRYPSGGEAIIGGDVVERLHMEVPSGSIHVFDQQTLPVVGAFRAFGPLQPLNNSVLIGAAADDVSVRTLFVVAATPDAVEPLLRPILEVIAPAPDASDTNSSEPQVETSATLADVRRVVEGELGRYSRSLILAALAVGLVLTSVTVLAATALRRRDFGRRRALGASRSAIIVLVIVQTASAALLGAVVGSAAGTVIVGQVAGATPPPSFVVSVAALAVSTALTAAVPPAAIAATRDPVRILRVP